MRETKKITVSAMAVALGVVFMALGYFVEVLDLTVAALCSVIMIIVFVEIGKPYTFLVWLATSLLGAIFYTSKLVWVTYFLLFGIYPILKAYIERAKRFLWIPLKLLFFNAVSPLMILISEKLLGIPFFGEDLSIPFLEGREWLFKLLVYLALNVVLLVYDFFLTVMIRAYFSKFRDILRKVLK